jgi:hypothetical protein
MKLHIHFNACIIKIKSAQKILRNEARTSVVNTVS